MRHHYIRRSTTCLVSEFQALWFYRWCWDVVVFQLSKIRKKEKGEFFCCQRQRQVVIFYFMTAVSLQLFIPRVQTQCLLAANLLICASANRVAAWATGRWYPSTETTALSDLILGICWYTLLQTNSLLSQILFIFSDTEKHRERSGICVL